MTKPAPIEAAMTARDWLALGPAESLEAVGIEEAEVEALRQLVDFALQFEMQSLPGELSHGFAGELHEIRLGLETVKVEEVDLVRVNGRVFVPETIEVDDDDEEVVLHVAGNGKELKVGQAEEIAYSLEKLAHTLRPAGLWHASQGSRHGQSIDGGEAGAVANTGARFIRFLVKAVLEEKSPPAVAVAELRQLAGLREAAGAMPKISGTSVKELVAYFEKLGA